MWTIFLLAKCKIGNGNRVTSIMPSTKRKHWNTEEDTLLMDAASNLAALVNRSGQVKVRVPWRKVSQEVPNRSPKQCRDRYNCLLVQSARNDKSITSPSRKQSWKPEEDSLLLTMHEVYQNQWVKIAAYFPGRSDNMIKSRYRFLSQKYSSPMNNLTMEPIDNTWAVHDQELSRWCSTMLEMNYL
mmetsp:Transcript_9994/g.16359  ORF Transcript_9994/g.16359 Transcript_9994/m.16359 type:complete len:185 (+) Transcript_9994:441-995(+)